MGAHFTIQWHKASSLVFPLVSLPRRLAFPELVTFTTTQLHGVLFRSEACFHFIIYHPGSVHHWGQKSKGPGVPSNSLQSTQVKTGTLG